LGVLPNPSKFVLVNTVPELVRKVRDFILLPENVLKTHRFYVEWISAVIALCIKLILGLWLFFGSRGLVGSLKKIRNLGLENLD